MGVFYLLVTMAAQGEVRVGRGEFGETRVWLIREAGEQGLGFSRARVVSGNEAVGAVCVETRVSFLMLRAAERPQPVSYCECLEKVGENWTSTGECLAQPSSTY